MHLHPFLRVELVEWENSDASFGGPHPNMLDELIDGREIGQMLRVADQMPHGDQRMSLAAAVGQFELTDCFLTLTGET